MHNNFWQLQKAANLSNQKCADFLGITKRTVERYRSGQLNAPKACKLALSYYVKHGEIK
tara:strand:+ start:521 stop:697 length:177 start_codon:yes stop_codon:yes gene_type:complete